MTIPRGPLRYLVKGTLYDAVTDVQEEFVEVWHIALPASEFKQVRWQDTFAEGEMERIVPLQKPHLSSDPSERAQLQRLYRLPYYSVSTLHGGMLLGINYIPARMVFELTAVDLETGRVGLCLGANDWGEYGLNVVHGQLLYTTKAGIRILALPGHTLQRQYANVMYRRESLERLEQQEECRMR